jgi:RHS repeat-associated protein
LKNHIHLLCAFVIALALPQQVNAIAMVTPANSINTQSVYGPKTVAAGKVYNETFKASSNVDGVISLTNGSGRDLHSSTCSGSILQRLLCSAENLLKTLEVSLLRAKSVEISLNNQIILSHNVFDPANAVFQLAIKTKTGTPVNAVVNSLKLDVKGLPLATVTVQVKAQTQTANQLPIARMSATPALGVAPLIVNFSGLLSSDSDGSIASYEWNFGDPSSGVANSATGAMPIHTYAVAGNYTITLVVKDNQGASASVTSVVKVALNKPPVAVFTASPESGPAPLMVVLNASQSSDQDGTVDTFIWDFGDGSSGNGAQVNHTFNQPGQFTIKLSVRDDKGAQMSAQKSITVAAANIAPTAVIRVSKNQGISPFMVSFDGSQSTDSDGSIVSYSWDFGNGVTATGQRVNHDFATGNFTVKLKVKDNWGGENSMTVTISATDPVLPPKPEQVAPALSQTEITLPGEMTEFLYKGDNPIQTGVAEGTIDERFISVIRGKVLQEDGSPLSGAVVKILGDDRYGQTLTREDGQYDLAVNGGGSLVISFERNGYYGAQRKVTSSHLAFAVLEDVFMLRPDPKVTVLATNSDIPQVAKGSLSSDSDGTRTATVVMPSQTAASLRMPDGSLIPVPQLSIRAKEYTVGPNGRKRMPAELPSTSAYTYAVQLSADEAIAKGASGIEFSKPVSFYVDNFLGFSIGDAMPVGIYNLDKGRWEPSKNGRVIKINSIENGKAVLDVTGNGLATAADLALLNIDDEELKTLASSYSAGTSLWRARLTHFSIVDLNVFQTDISDVSIPVGPPANPTDSPINPTNQCGSIIEVDTRSLGETIPISGTPYNLYYSSKRVPGRTSVKAIEIPLTPGSLSGIPKLRAVDLKVVIAGQEYQESFPPLPSQQKVFVWNGKDAFGRDLPMGQTASVTVTYKVDANYLKASYVTADETTFAYLGPGLTVSNIRSREYSEFTRTYNTVVGSNETSLQQGIAGWTFDVNHVYDPVNHILYLGDGKKRTARNIGQIITRVAGGGFPGNAGDGGQALNATLNFPSDLTIAKDNSVYFRDAANFKIRKVDSNGIISTVAGTGVFGSSADGLSAVNSKIGAHGGIAISTEGERALYFAEYELHMIKKMSQDGTISRLAGIGIPGFAGDGGPANLARMNTPTEILMKDGSIYFNDSKNNRVRVIRPDGVIQTVAGNGTDGFSGDGGPAVEASISQPFGLSVGPNGDLYLADTINGRIRRIDRSGVITTIAGGGSSNAEGISALESKLLSPTRVVVAEDNSLFIASPEANMIKKVSPDGIMTTFAGTSSSQSSSFEGELAGHAALVTPFFIDIGPEGSLYFVDGHMIKKITRPLVGVGSANILIPSEDGAELFSFDRAGKHLETRYALSGALKLKFTYDANNRLASILDSNGNLTAINRNSAGLPTQIVGPFGHVTTLGTSSQGYISTLTNPAGETFRMTYLGGGLLSSFTKPKGNMSFFDFDQFGNLAKDQDAAGGFKSFSRIFTSTGYTIPVTTAEGRQSSVKYQIDSIGNQVSTQAGPHGLVRESVHSEYWGSTITSPRQTTFTMNSSDPRLGAAAQYPSSRYIRALDGSMKFKFISRKVVPASDGTNNFVQEDTIDENSGKSFLKFELQPLLWTRTTAEGRVIKTYVDSKDRPIRIQRSGLSDINYEYNDRGFVEKVSQGSLRSIQYIYDNMGRLEFKVNALGEKVRNLYDQSDRVVQKIYPDGHKVSMSYDSNGNLLSVTPDGKPEHTLSYNVVDNLISYLPPSLGGPCETQYVYNLDKQLISKQSPNGSFANYIYPAGSNRLRSIVTDNGTYSYLYDSTGQIRETTSPSLVTTKISRNGNLVYNITNSGQALGSIAFTYNSDFRVVSSNVNLFGSVTFGYDKDGLLTSAGPMALSYNSLNSLLEKTKVGAVDTSYSYNPEGEQIQRSVSVGGTNIYALNFERDLIGRISSKNELVSGNSEVSSYSYDLSGRLVKIVKNGDIDLYVYDSNGNRLSRTKNGETVSAQYNDQDQLMSYGLNSYTYDAEGSLKTKITGTAVANYSYDIFSNLKEVNLPDGRNISYMIDGLNRRVGKAINGLPVKFWVYESKLKIAAELDASGNLVSRFLYGRGHRPEMMIKNGVNYKIVTDNVGSVRLVLNGATGEVVQKIEYDEFGQVLFDSNPGFQPFGFAGGLYDNDTKLARFGARDYDAETGRWTVKDPIGFGGGASNLYSYVGSDPVNFVDPTGLKISFSDPASVMLYGQMYKNAPDWQKVFLNNVARDESIEVCIGIGTLGKTLNGLTTTRVGTNVVDIVINGDLNAMLPTQATLMHEFGHVEQILRDVENDPETGQLPENTGLYFEREFKKHNGMPLEE